MADPSIFRPETVVPYEVHREYLRKCVECDNVFQNTKYTLLRMHTENPNMGLQNEIGQALVKAKTYEDIWYVPPCVCVCVQARGADLAVV